ncbi:MAG: hypothetical protein WBL35_07210 [Ornithinibacter sp.]
MPQQQNPQRRKLMDRTTIGALALSMITALVAAVAVPAAASDAAVPIEAVTTLTGGATGTALGPGGDLYVASPQDGTIYRIDRHTHDVTTFHEGLPAQVLPLGGVMDIAFQGSTAYALVTLVGSDVGGHAVVGLYRLDGPTSTTLVADLGRWSTEHPPSTEYFVPSGVQYALQPFRGGFLVTDGHHNRVLRVGTNGSIEELFTLGNVVPTGLDWRGSTILLAEAGPVPHDPATGRVVAVDVFCHGDRRRRFRWSPSGGRRTGSGVVPLRPGPRRLPAWRGTRRSCPARHRLTASSQLRRLVHDHRNRP